MKDRVEKNWPLMESIIWEFTPPNGFKWKIMTNYKDESYLRLLDEAALVVYTSQYESFGFQLFEAWAKAVPVIYKRKLWGNIPFNGCGGISLDETQYSIAGYVNKIKYFLSLSEGNKFHIGNKSRRHVLKHFCLSGWGGNCSCFTHK